MDLQPIEEVGSLKYSHSKNYEKGGRGVQGKLSFLVYVHVHCGEYFVSKIFHAINFHVK